MRKAVDIALIVIGLVLLFVVMHHELVGTDGQDRYRAVRTLIKTGEVSRTPYSFIGPLFAAPLYPLGKLAGGFRWWCERYNTLLFAVGLLAIYLALRRDLEKATTRRFVLIMVAASMFPNHLRNFSGEVFSAMTVGLGIVLLGLRRRRSGWGWLPCVLGVANIPAQGVGFALITFRRMLADKRIRYGLALAAVAALVLAENTLRRGHPLSTCYENNHGLKTDLPYSGLPGFSYPLGFGLLSLLFSFGKGLVFFAPGLLLSWQLRYANLKPDVIRMYKSFLLFIAGLLLVYARWWAWYGGFCWGPRFFLIASIPASLALASAIENARTPMRRGLTLALLLLSCWVGLNGMVFNLDEMASCAAHGYRNECFMWYLPEFSVLWRPFVQHRALKTNDWILVAYGVIVFLWLAIPLMRGLAGDLVRGVRAAGNRLLPVGEWKW